MLNDTVVRGDEASAKLVSPRPDALVQETVTAPGGQPVVGDDPDQLDIDRVLNGLVDTGVDNRRGVARWRWIPDGLA